jgi:hypothetical protein
VAFMGQRFFFFFEVIYITIYEGRESLPYEKYRGVLDGFTSQVVLEVVKKKRRKKGKLLRH